MPIIDIDKKPRILLVLHLPPPVHGASIVGNFIHESDIINSAFNCQYINLSGSRELKEIQRFNLAKIRIYLSLYFHVFKAIINFKPDVCYATINSSGRPFYKDFGIVFLFRLFNKRTVYHYHNRGISLHQSRKIDNALYRFTFKKARAILLSPLLYTDVKKYLPEERVFYCPNGIRPISSPASKQKSGKACQLLFVSNMMKEKGVHDLLNACRILHENGTNFQCDFVGEWHTIDRESFNQMVSDYGLEGRVTAHGGIYSTEKNSFYAHADIFIFPSHNEAFPLVLLEAMQHGLPCISTDIGGTSEIVLDDENGYLVPVQNPEVLADRIHKLISDPEKRKAFGAKGKELFKDKYTVDKFESQMYKIFTELCDKCDDS